jgi:zinc transport system permease protein
MTEFLQALGNPDVPFLKYAVIAGMLSSVSFGVVGSYVVVKKITSIAGSIAHSVLAGIGLSLYLQGQHTVEWFTPILGAMIAAVFSACIIGFVSIYGKQREDTIIGSVWAMGMALGVLFISLTPTYVDPMSYLFGNILIISRQELIFIAVLDVVVIFLGIFLYRQFLAVSFDEEFARARGLNTAVYTMLLLLLTALSIVLLTTIVGIIMVIALLTIPAAMASLFSRSLWKIMLIAVLFTMVFTFFGTGISYALDTPSGSTIILFAGGLYILGVIVKKVTGRFKKGGNKDQKGGREGS